MLHGTPTGSFIELKSQMMRHPRDGEFPGDHIESSSSNEEATETVFDATNQVSATRQPITSANGSSSSDSENIVAVTTVLDGSDSESEQDPDEDIVEDIPFFSDSAEAEQSEFSATNFMEARGIERDIDKHKAKWDTHLVEKDALIEEKWKVTLKAPRKQAIGIGEKVQEKAGRKRVGIGEKDDREGDSGPGWSVKFEDGVEENIPSQKLVLVRDNREFVWETVRDSTPDNLVVLPNVAGVAGFPFEEYFGD